MVSHFWVSSVEVLLTYNYQICFTPFFSQFTTEEFMNNRRRAGMISGSPWVLFFSWVSTTGLQIKKGVNRNQSHSLRMFWVNSPFPTSHPFIAPLRLNKEKKKEEKEYNTAEAGMRGGKPKFCVVLAKMGMAIRKYWWILCLAFHPTPLHCRGQTGRAEIPRGHSQRIPPLPQSLSPKFSHHSSLLDELGQCKKTSRKSEI